MDENDKRFFEELLAKQAEQVERRFNEQTEQFQRRMDEQTVQLQHHVDVVVEHFDHKIAVIAEGHQMLAEKMDRFEFGLTAQLDKIAADVAAHRADTEAHHGIYRVKES